MLELTYQRQKYEYDMVRGSLFGLMLFMVKLDLWDKDIQAPKPLSEYIDSYAKTEKIVRVNGKAKRFF